MKRSEWKRRKRCEEIVTQKSMKTIVSPGIYTYGSMVIGGILKSAGYDVTLTKRLDVKPDTDTVFVSLYSTLQLMDEKIKRFFNLLAGKRVIVGGPVSAYPEIVLGELSNVSAVVIGEGEETVLDLAENDISEETPGIAFIEDEDLIVTERRARPRDLSRPLPLIPSDISEQQIRGANVYIETHRGCLGSCDFCQVPEFFGREIRSRRQEEILDEVRAFKDAGVERIAVSGGTGSLYGYRKKLSHSFVDLLQEISEIIGEKNLSVPDMRVDYLNSEVLEAIRTYTIGWIFLGIESGSDNVLKEMHKGTTAEKAMNAIENARSHGVHVAGSFIVGHPAEREEDYNLTRRFIEDAMLEDVFVSIAEPIPSTSLAKEIAEIAEEENPSFKPHTGEYAPLKLRESEARCFDLMLTAETSKPVPRIITNQQYDELLKTARTQGDEIRRITQLIKKYTPTD